MYIYTSLPAKQRTFTGVAVLILLLAAIGAIFATVDQTKTPSSSPALPAAIPAANYGLLPISFVPNAGQSDAVVRYQANAMGGMLFFEDDALVLSLRATDRGQQTEDQTRSVVYLRFDGVDRAHRVVNAERLPGNVNYLIGNEPSRWLTGLPTYASIIYEQLYPGIDLRYDGAQSTLKGTYTLAPLADPSRIRWHYQGTTGVRVDEQTGDLLLALEDGSTLIEKAPSAWQTIAGMRMSVTVQYAVMKDDSLGFTLGDYDTNQPLTIDPVLIYSTYLGGSSFDGAKSVAVDFAGNAYITGVTQSINFPTKNPLFNTRNGDTDAFIVKINPTGTELVYATYLGGSNREDEFGNERAGGIAVDSSGFAYVTGCTNSADFPTVNPIQPTHGATTNCDAFVSKLNETGNGLIYSTFLGGPGADAANAIAVDDQGSAYIVGDAGKDFPGDPFTSSTHVFVAKINPAGSAVVFSMFLRGNSYEFATDVAVDSAHNIYVVGNTFSTDFPVTPNAAQPTKGGGSSNNNHDAFVTKIKADGSGLVYSTYLGGSKDDEASGIALDDLGNAYITGVTQSTLDFPIKNAFQPAYGGERGDAFVTKLNPAGTEFVYSTYLGGNNDENYFGGHGPYGAIAVDSTYNAVVTGYTCSANFPTLGSYLKGKVGTCYAFVTGFNAAGNALVFSTLIGTQSGGSNDALGTDIALDPLGNVYVVGETNATDLLTMNPLQSSRAGLYDAFVTKIDPHFATFLPLTVKAPPPTATLKITSPNGDEQWQPGTTHNITWKQSGLSSNVTLQLYKGGSLSSQVGTAGATAGSFAWTIPSNQATGHDYQIRIFQGSVEDYSDANFFIVTVRKYDLLGSWATGVSSLNSDTGAWNLITSSAASQIAAGDMDGDGKADLVAIFPSSGLWVKYSATGQWQFISSPPTWITVGDFNGDGKADLAGIWGGVVWLRDSATGSWTAGPSGATQIAAGDMDGDGKTDLVANFPTTGVWVQYSSSGPWSNLSTDPATSIAVGDFNGDGKADLAGIWNNVIWIRDSMTGSWTSSLSDATMIGAGDMDGDGKADLVGNWSDTGVNVQYSSTNAWSNLTTSPATWIATGILR
jgi:Ser-Thr-rich glycosyl-phosphatidyl-inositol-anchored membrane family/FG-GAP-like repeat/Beta-propeller repeat/FG-GAP repeat